MDYHGMTPAELYADDLARFNYDKEKLESNLEQLLADRKAIIRLPIQDNISKTFEHFQKEEQRLRNALYELSDQERMLVLLSPLYEKDEE